MKEPYCLCNYPSICKATARSLHGGEIGHHCRESVTVSDRVWQLRVKDGGRRLSFPPLTASVCLGRSRSVSLFLSIGSIPLGCNGGRVRNAFNCTRGCKFLYFKFTTQVQTPWKVSYCSLEYIHQRQEVFISSQTASLWCRRRAWWTQDNGGEITFYSLVPRELVWQKGLNVTSVHVYACKTPTVAIFCPVFHALTNSLPFWYFHLWILILSVISHGSIILKCCM